MKRLPFILALYSIASFAQITVGAGRTVGHGHVSAPPTAFVFVSPTGNDSNNCLSIGAPCLTPQHATTVVDAQSATQKIVQFADGLYPNTSWTLGSGDSGTSVNHVQYRAAPGATPIISGGKTVTGWANCDRITHCVNIPLAAMSCTGCSTPVFVTLASASFSNFEALYYNGARRYRPRSPYTDPTTGTGAWYCQSGLNGSTIEPCSNLSPPGGTLTMVCVTSSSSFYPATGPCPGTGGNNKACYSCLLRDPGDTQTTFHGVGGSGCSAAGTCTGIQDVEVVPMEKWTAARMRMSPANSDGTNTCTPSATLLCFTGLTSSGVGAGSCAAGNCNFGPLAGHNYFLDNVVESFSHKQQWYLDRDPTNAGAVGSTWELIYIPATGENPSTATVIIPQQTAILSATNATNIDFVGLTFSHDDFTVAAGGQAALSDASNIPAAVSFTNPVGINFNGNTFSHLMAWAAELKGSNGITQTGIINSFLNNDLYDLGSAGLRIGLTETVSDTTANVAQFNYIANNRASYGQLFMPGGTGVAFWVGNSPSNTLVQLSCDYWYNGCYGVGGSQGNAGLGAIVANSNTLSLLECSNIGMGVTSDMGCIHTHTGSATGNTLSTSLFHDVTSDPINNFYYNGYNASCLYIDNSSSNWTVTKLLTYNCGEENVIVNNAADNLGAANSITQSIFALGRNAAIKKAGDASVFQLTMTNDIFYGDVWNSHNGPQCDSPVCPGSAWTDPTKFTLNNNTYFNKVNTLGSGTPFYQTVTGSPVYKNTAAWQALPEDASSTFTVDPGFVAPTSPTYNFAFSGAAPSGFTTFVYSLAGAKGFPTLPASAASYAFPITLLSPASF